MRIPIIGRFIKPVALVLGVGAGALAWIRRSEPTPPPLTVVPTSSSDGRELRSRVVGARNERVTARASLPPTKKELYELAKKHDVPGRSKMTKAELQAALRAT